MIAIKKNHKDLPRQRLSWKLLIATWAVSSLATLLFTVVQIYSDYYRDYKKLTDNFAIVERSYLQSLSEHLWSYDSRLIEIQLDGLKRLDGISYLSLRDANKEIYISGRSHKSEQNSRSFKIYHSESKELLGTLDVEIDLDSLQDKYLKEVVWIFVRQAAKTLIVVFILYFIFTHLIVAPLAKISAYLSKPEAERQGPLSLERPSRRTNDELDVLVENINEFRDQNQEKISSLSNLTSGIAHEISTPLESLKSAADVLKESLHDLNKATSPEQVFQISSELKSASGIITKSTQRLNQIVKTMQMLTTNPNSTFGIVDVESLVQESIRNIRTKYEESNMMRALRIDLDLQEIKIRAQKKPLLVAIDNILDNALFSLENKYKELGESFEPNLKIQSEILKDKIRISIWDNGKGIDLDAIDKIFEPFFTTKPFGEGAGLGLSIAYDVVKRQGGQLRLADSNKNEFAHFVIELPLSTRIFT